MVAREGTGVKPSIYSPPLLLPAARPAMMVCRRLLLRGPAAVGGEVRGCSTACVSAGATDEAPAATAAPRPVRVPFRGTTTVEAVGAGIAAGVGAAPSCHSTRLLLVWANAMAGPSAPPETCTGVPLTVALATLAEAPAHRHPCGLAVDLQGVRAPRNRSPFKVRNRRIGRARRAADDLVHAPVVQRLDARVAGLSPAAPASSRPRESSASPRPRAPRPESSPAARRRPPPCRPPPALARPVVDPLARRQIDGALRCLHR